MPKLNLPFGKLIHLFHLLIQRIANQLNSREGETFHLTENESYFFHISCDEKGDYIIWAVTATSNADVSTIIRAINALSNFGIRPKFKLSRCSDKSFDFTK
ncbi:uncharacterized protein LOC120339489 [Styela clava]